MSFNWKINKFMCVLVDNMCTPTFRMENANVMGVMRAVFAIINVELIFVFTESLEHFFIFAMLSLLLYVGLDDTRKYSKHQQSDGVSNVSTRPYMSHRQTS